MTDENQFISKLFLPTLCVPINDMEGKVQPMVFELSEGAMILGFSSPKGMARFFEREVEFIELAPRALLSMALERTQKIGFDLHDDHAVILDQTMIGNLLAHLDHRETVIDVERFEFEKFQASPDFIKAVGAILEEGQTGFFLLDRAEGYVLVLDLANGEFDSLMQHNLHQLLAGFEDDMHVNLMVLPKTESRMDALRPLFEEYGHKIVPQAREKRRKPPILKSYSSTTEK